MCRPGLSLAATPVRGVSPECDNKPDEHPLCSPALCALLSLSLDHGRRELPIRRCSACKSYVDTTINVRTHKVGCPIEDAVVSYGKSALPALHHLLKLLHGSEAYDSACMRNNSGAVTDAPANGPASAAGPGAVTGALGAGLGDGGSASGSDYTGVGDGAPGWL